MAAKESSLLDVYLKEYDRLKSEQLARIGFRDNLIYVTIVVISGVLTLAFRDPPNFIALLVIPWATLILGWTYLVNDEKISAAGKYIRQTMVEKIQPLLGEVPIEALMAWKFSIAVTNGAGDARLSNYSLTKSPLSCRDWLA